MTAYPMKAEDGVFEIGLVMAGAVSAGAYTAGAIDYLLEKLEAYWAWRGRDPSAPRHEVRLRVLSGASAGGICAAIMAAQCLGRMKPDAQARGFDPDKTVLYNLWVNGVDIREMLTLDDLADKDAPVLSLLNTRIIDELSRQGIDLEPHTNGALPPYFSDPVDIFLSLANMRGVPYGLSAQGVARRYGHEMALHADYIRFSLHSDAAQPSPEQARAYRLIPANLGVNDEGWLRLSDAARATSAFPIGLRARSLRRVARDYNKRAWPVPQASPPPCVAGQDIPPAWELADDADFDALYVDGGLMNNEPLELARTAMAGIGGRNPRDPKTAFRATLLLDPFPDSVALDPDYQPKDTIVDVALAMFGALKTQARFKPDELALALDNTSFSRFLLSPTRREEDGSLTLPALQSDIVGAFGGFLARAFREHDYHLGRRNCERFLKKHFYLHADNPVFKGWQPGAPYLENKPLGEGDAIPTLPILPIEDPAREECPLPIRRKGVEVVDMAELHPLIKGRVNRVLKRLLKNTLGLNSLLRFFAINFGAGKVVKAIEAKLNAELMKLK